MDGLQLYKYADMVKRGGVGRRILSAVISDYLSVEVCLFTYQRCLLIVLVHLCEQQNVIECSKVYQYVTVEQDLIAL